MQKQNDFAAYREGEALNFMVDMARIRAMRSIAEYRHIRTIAEMEKAKKTLFTEFIGEHEF